MNGWRLLTVFVTAAVVVGLTATPAAAASQGEQNTQEDKTYLALGDSVAFGFNPLANPANAANFIGYPEVLATRLDLALTNASCTGEASGGFISLTGADNGCRLYREFFPLHVNYTTSQLDFAVAFLRTHPQTRLVTLDLGANDFFLLRRQCNENIACISNGLPGMLQVLANNLTTIYGRLRGQAHYTHKLVALTYYVTNYSDAVAVSIFTKLNQTIAQATLASRGSVADGFGEVGEVAARAGGDSCGAGLLIVTSISPLTCDIHPSVLGRETLAEAIQEVLRQPETE